MDLFSRRGGGKDVFVHISAIEKASAVFGSVTLSTPYLEGRFDLVSIGSIRHLPILGLHLAC